MTWLFAFLWWCIGFMAGCGFMMWVHEARKYHESRTQDYIVEPEGDDWRLRKL